MISKDKQYRTRDGREVRIYATDGGPDWPVQGAIKLADGWIPFIWNTQGCCSCLGITDGDLIEVKPRIKREYWVNVYSEERQQNSLLHRTREIAIGMRGPDCKGCVKVVIDCEEGEGL